MNAFPVPVSGSAFSLRVELPLAKPAGSTTHTKRLEKAFVLFLNKSIKQMVDVPVMYYQFLKEVFLLPE